MEYTLARKSSKVSAENIRKLPRGTIPSDVSLPFFFIVLYSNHAMFWTLDTWFDRTLDTWFDMLHLVEVIMKKTKAILSLLDT